MCTLQWQLPSGPNAHNHLISQIQETYKEKLLTISLLEVFHKKFMGTFMTSWNFWAVFISTPPSTFLPKHGSCFLHSYYTKHCSCWELYTAELCNINTSIYRRSIVQAGWRWFIWCEETLPHPFPSSPPPTPQRHTWLQLQSITVVWDGNRRKPPSNA